VGFQIELKFGRSVEVQGFCAAGHAHGGDEAGQAQDVIAVHV
jgi:hypothetical protein